MTSVYNFNSTEMIVFFLILMRVGGFLLASPILSAEFLPAPIKILLAFALSLAISGGRILPQAELPTTEFALGLLIAQQLVVGLALGFLARFFFFCLSVAAEIISSSMGLSSAQLFNPALGSQGSSIETFFAALGTLVFFMLNGHLMLISGLVKSLDVIPATQFGLKPNVFMDFAGVVQQIVDVGVALSAPVFLTILILNLAMGVVGRAVPQINVLITSLPVNVLVGLMVLIITMPLFIAQLSKVNDDGVNAFVRFIAAVS